MYSYAKFGQLHNGARAETRMDVYGLPADAGGTMTIDNTTGLITSAVVGSSYDPTIFGPSLWFVLHNGATAYPALPTPYVREGMRQLLTTMPLLVPCATCREHFYAFLKACDLNAAVQSRESLFAFLVAAHNYVNARYGKPTMSVAEAKAMYGYDNIGRGSRVRLTYTGDD
jgi:hypothetical protein